MTAIKRLIVLALALILSGGIVAARPLTDAENRALANTVTTFDAAMQDSDYAIVTKTIPPKMLAHLASTAGIEVAALLEMVIEQMKAALAGVKIESFSMDLTKAEYRELQSGEPYVLIPTEMIMDTGETGRFKAKSYTLGLLDEGAWYLLRVETGQIAIMRQVYPEFIGVEFDSGSVEALK
jgi:hypothetical protein